MPAETSRTDVEQTGNFFSAPSGRLLLMAQPEVDMQRLLDKIEVKITRYSSSTYRKPDRRLLLAGFRLFRALVLLAQRRSQYTDAVFHIGFRPRNGIGDCVYAVKYLFCLKKRFGDAVQIDLLVKDQPEAVRTLFSGRNVRACIAAVHAYAERPRYDCEISLARFPVVDRLDRRRLASVADTGLRDYLERLVLLHQQQPQLYRSDYLGSCYSMLMGRRREDQADIDGSLAMPAEKAFTIGFDSALDLRRFALAEDAYIVVQTGGGRHFSHLAHETRQWPLERYAQLLAAVREAHPELRIVQLGEAYHPAIPGVDLNLLGKTNFEEMLALLCGARLLISQEGGFPILRHFACRKPSCVLFGPTYLPFLGFDENINLTAGVCPGCERLTQDWMARCARTGGAPLCMASLDCETVTRAVMAFLAR